MTEFKEMGVVEVTTHIVDALKKDSSLSNVIVHGEVSNFKYSGPHAYFSLTEKDCLLNCVMFNALYKLNHRKIEDGTLIKVYGSIRVYTKRGTYQFYTESIKEGTDYGALYRKLEELKKRLKAEGIFDKPKKSIPRFPKRIAVVSSRTSAAFRDVINTVKKRYPLAEILLFHTGVQGKEAIEETVRALKLADMSDADVVLLVRGGGSMEDLWNFNEEAIVRKVYEMRKPVITGVGHETDTTLVDYVADLRAPTPTGAAERATPELAELSKIAKRNFGRLLGEISVALSGANNRIFNLHARLETFSPKRMLALKMQKTRTIMNDIYRLVAATIERRIHDVERASDALRYAKPVRMSDILPDRLESIWKMIKRSIVTKVDKKLSEVMRMESELKLHDPNEPLKRGYSMVFKGNTVVKTISQVEINDLLMVVFKDGSVLSEVKEVQSGRK